MANNPTPGSLFVAIWGDWGTRMSGIVSVPLTALALFYPGWDLRWLWVVMAVIALGYTIYGTWARERKRVVQLEEQIRPKIRIECSEGITGCHTNPTLLSMGPAGQKVVRFFRAAITTGFPGVITGCCGKIIAIEKNGQLIWGGDTQELTFAPGNAPDALSKKIHESPEFLDILCVSTDGEIIMATPGFRWRFGQLQRTFPENGDYYLSIVVIGNDVPEAVARLRFHWTGNWATSTIALAD